MPNVLIVEDEPAMAVALKDGFEYEGYTTEVVGDGVAALERVKEIQPALIILDVMLPKMNGLDVCKQLRNDGFNLPIIMLSARGQEIDKVLGLKLGADDYITKPFSFMELIARVEAVLRRTESGNRHATVVQFGDITVDRRKRTVQKSGERVVLSAREYRLLEYFIDHEGEVIERDTLLDAVWDQASLTLTRTVDVHVAKLRKKLEENPSDPQYFLTVHRMGYKFDGHVAAGFIPA
ncbi:MAG: response regulator transcription factor [Myxococcota bacterium]|nr:response regulator transcription factor [Myxococcota bacterium]